MPRRGGDETQKRGHASSMHRSGSHDAAGAPFSSTRTANSGQAASRDAWEPALPEARTPQRALVLLEKGQLSGSGAAPSQTSFFRHKPVPARDFLTQCERSWGTVCPRTVCARPRAQAVACAVGTVGVDVSALHLECQLST
eukprot:355127-Chlamydomonas_euryale.AAC.4